MYATENNFVFLIPHNYPPYTNLDRRLIRIHDITNGKHLCDIREPHQNNGKYFLHTSIIPLLSP